MYFNELLIQFVFNIQDEMLSKIFLIVFSGSIFGIVSALVGYPLLAAFGHIKYANNSLIYASIVHVLYITSIVIYNKDIYLLSLSLPIYMIVGLIFRIYYVNKTKLL